MCENKFSMYKILLLGNSGVGKSIYLSNFSKYIDNYPSLTPNHYIIDTLDIWEIPGREYLTLLYYNKNNLCEEWFKDADGAIILCDVTHDNCVQSLLNWIELFKKRYPNKPFILVGNYCESLSIDDIIIELKNYINININTDKHMNLSEPIEQIKNLIEK